METNGTRKRKYSKKKFLKKFTEMKKPNQELKIRKNKTFNNEEKPCLKKNEVYLLSPNSKLASK